MELSQIFYIALGTGCLIILLLLILVLVEAFRIIRNFRMVSDRIEILSDVSGWFQFFRKTIFTRKNKKKN